MHQAPIRLEGKSKERLVLLLSPVNGESKVLPPNPYLLRLLSKEQMVTGTQWELLQEAAVLRFRHTPSSPAGATGRATARDVPNSMPHSVVECFPAGQEHHAHTRSLVPTLAAPEGTPQNHNMDPRNKGLL